MIAASQHAPAPASYTVRSGDTLSQLAVDFYGRASKYPEIQDANPAVIKDPNLIYTGDTLKIPDASFVPVADADTVYVPKHKAYYTPKHAKASVAVSGTHSANTTVAASGNMVQIATYLENHGGTKAGAAGVAACIWGESEGNPESVGSGGFGYIGWTGNTIGLPPGFNGPTGNAAADSAAELAGVVGYINAEGGWGPINGAGGPVAAAEVFSSQYERPAVRYSDIHYGGAGDPTGIFNAL